MWRIYRKNGFRKLGGPIPLTRSPSFVISSTRLRPQVIPDDRKEAKTYFRKTGFGRRLRLCGNDDTRHKIQLGGLVIKAGLAGEEPAVLLGIITAAKWVLSVK
jgi:hypothetical protein